MRLNDDLEIFDLALYLVKHNALVVADVHVGFEEALNRQGVLIPRFQFNEVVKRLGVIISSVLKAHKLKKLDKIIVNGDIKHEFGAISEQEWRDTLKLLDFLCLHCDKLVLVRGNHDTILGPIADKREIEVVDELVLGDVLIVHGHKLPAASSKLQAPSPKLHTVVIAHEHPAVSLQRFPRSELFKCWLKGRWKGKDLIVMPSFNLVTEGTDVLKESLLSPFLKGVKLDDFECYVVEDKVYDFGKLKNLK